MSWNIYLVLVAFTLYLCYNFVILSLFGIPRSLSQTFYDFEARKPWMRIFFPIMMIGVGVLLLPSWLEISDGSNFMFTSFLAAAGIIFSGSAPAFKRSDLEDKVHTGSAFFAATFAIIWIILVAKLWWFIIVWTAIISIVAFITKTWKTGLVYWLETITFMSTFTSIIAYFTLK
jgi:hypothetical protein